MMLEELLLPIRADASGLKAGVKAAGVVVAALVATMGLAIKASFKWADELDSITDVIGGTSKQAAAFNFILRKSGVSADTFTKGLVILGKGLIKADGSLDTTGKSLKAWGIDVLDANGALKDQTTLIGDISEKYASFATQQEKVNFLTETFGRSGAELIDFFDTLANDGGIDAVAAKIERLGLAIDPNRYEQFNRNLEELKLVGLAMAVSFTEKVMPVIEKFLEMISDPEGIDLNKIASWADKTIAKFIDGMAVSVLRWSNGGGPEALSESLISWIEGIGDSDFTKSKIQIAMEHLVIAMGEALSNIDWSAIGTVIETKVNETFAVMDPAIRTSLDTIDATFNTWLAGEPVAWMDQLDTTLNEGTKKALGNAGVNFTNWAAGVNTTVDTWAAGIQVKYQTWADGVNATVDTWASDTTTKFETALSELNTTIDDKLRAASKTFFNVASGWGQQMQKGFDGNLGALLSGIAGMVQEINGILAKIATSFHLSITYSMDGEKDGRTPLRPKPRPNSPGGPVQAMASGGPVSGGSAYMVGEMGPELFVPRGSGTIVPNGSGAQQVTITNWNGFVFNYAELATQIIKAQNSA